MDVRVTRGVITGLLFVYDNDFMVCVLHVHLGLICLLLDSVGTGLFFHLYGYGPGLSPYFGFGVKEVGVLRFLTNVT